MFHYEQNASLSHIHQQERIAEAERSRLAADPKPRIRIYGAVFAYAARKCGALGQALKGKREVVLELPPTSTQEIAAVR